MHRLGFLVHIDSNDSLFSGINLVCFLFGKLSGIKAYVYVVCPWIQGHICYR